MINHSISVVIPVYNGENHIEVQLRSILNQTLLPNDIIICDDCSTDKTVDVINNIINESPINKRMIKIFKNSKRLGMDLNFEKAISLCDSDYIFLSDADDYWFKNKISYMYNKIHNTNNLIALNNCRFADEKLISYKTKKIEQIEKIFLSSENFIPGCCVVFKKVLKDLYLPLPSHNQSYDGWLNFVSSKVSNRLLTKKVFQLYRRHSSNNSLAIFNRVDNLNILKILKIRLIIFIKTIFSRKKSLDKSIKNYKELLTRIKSLQKFKEIDVEKIKSDLNSLQLRKKLLEQSLILRFYNIFFKKKYNLIWKSKSSKILDLLTIN
tara:strand:+ start:158 stop:1126 length:969 start_codon:yes stop_codon:yes gene_type:complete